MKNYNTRASFGYLDQSYFFADEYMYASLLANKQRATECIACNNVERHYDREGWICLLLYYIDCIEMLVDKCPQAITYIDVIEYNKLLILESRTELKVKRFIPYHDMPLNEDIDVCRYTIEAIKIMQVIMDMECSIDYLKTEYLKLRNLEPCKEYNIGKYKTKYISI